MADAIMVTRIENTVNVPTKSAGAPAPVAAAGTPEEIRKGNLHIPSLHSLRCVLFRLCLALCEFDGKPLGREKSTLKPMSAPPANLFGPVDWYRTIRDQIQHEDNLIAQRLSWLMAAQSFLFTGYAIVATATPQARNPLLALLFNIIPGVACISDILIYCSVIAGVLSLYRLRRAYVTHVSSVGDFPKIEGSQLTHWLLGMASPILLPWVFLTAWLILWSQAHL
jgi:hypothetical protein